MTSCQSCGHDRLLHDSWGCKLRCTCGASIIYMTALFSVLDQAGQAEAIKQGNELVEEADRLEESHISALRSRATAEGMPEQLNMI